MRQRVRRDRLDPVVCQRQHLQGFQSEKRVIIHQDDAVVRQIEGDQLAEVAKAVVVQVGDAVS